MKLQLLYLCVSLQLYRNSSFHLVCPLSGRATAAIFSRKPTRKFKMEPQMLPSAWGFRTHLLLISTYLLEQLH